MSGYIGSYAVGATLTFYAMTHAVGGILTDADNPPAYRVYEEITGTPILTGNMAKLDDAGTTGFYAAQLDLSGGNGFEYGKCYCIYITAAVGGITGGAVRTFQVGAVVDVRYWLGTLLPGVDTAGYPRVTIKAGTGPGELSLTSGGVLVAAMASNVITSATLAGSAISTIQAGLSTLTQADVRTATGMAAANLDAQLGAIAAYIDTEVAAIKAKTDNLPADPASAGTISTSFSTQASTLSALAVALAAVAADVLLVKAKTDNIPSDPADESVITGQVNSILAAISAINTLVTGNPAANTTIGHLDAMLQNGGSGWLFTAYALSNVSGEVVPPVPAVLPVLGTVGARRSGTIRLGLGSTVPIRQEVLLRGDGGRYDLTGVYQVYYELRSDTDSAAFVYGEGEVYGDPLEGTVRYAWGVDDLSVRGTYREFWHVWFTTGFQRIPGGIISVE